MFIFCDEGGSGAPAAVPEPGGTSWRGEGVPAPAHPNLSPSLLQSEPEGFSHFHLYVCAAFLVRWRKEILEERDFQVSRPFTASRGPRGGAFSPRAPRAWG